MGGTRRTAGATHTSCKARPLVPLRLCTALGPQEPPSSPTRDGDGKGWKGRDILPGATRGKSEIGFRFALPQGTRLLKDCFRIEMAASQETSCTSVPKSPWEEEEGGGLAWGTEEKRAEGGSRGGAEQAAAGLSHRDPPSSRASGYLSSVGSGMPASVRAARNCIRTPRMLLMKPLESGKRGKPMSG